MSQPSPRDRARRALVHVLAIWQRELGGFFGRPAAWVFVAVFLGVSSLIGLRLFFDRNVSDLRDYFAGLRYTFVFLSPALAIDRAYRRLDAFRNSTSGRSLDALRPGSSRLWKDFYSDLDARQAEEFVRAELEGPREADLAIVPSGETVAERVTNRLLALGFEQIQIVTRSEKLAELQRNDGEVLVEAKREGVLHKGRVDLRAGRLADVEMNPAYSIFP